MIISYNIIYFIKISKLFESLLKEKWLNLQNFKIIIEAFESIIKVIQELR